MVPMKLPPTFWIWASLLWSGPALLAAEDSAAAAPAGAEANLDRATVTVPYAELKNLLQTPAAQAALHDTKTQRPPMPGGLLSAKLRLDCRDGQAALQAEFRVENFSGQWESIPLLGAGPAVSSIEPPDSRIVTKDGQLCLALNTPGSAAATLHFAAKASSAWQDGAVIDLVSLPCAVGSLEITGLPAELEAVVHQNEEAILGSPQGLFALPAQGGRLQVSLQARTEASPGIDAASVWSAQNEVTIRLDDSALRYAARCFLTAETGAGTGAELTLPTNARQIRAEGEDLASWRTERTGGGQNLLLRWKGNGILDREVTVRYSVPQPPLAASWNLTAPATAEPEKTRSLFVVAVPAGSALEADKLRPIAGPAGLSKWLASELQGESLAALEGTASATVRVKALPQAVTADGTVKLAQYQSRIVADGSTITEATLDIEHEGTPRFAIDLPADCALLKCALNGRSVKPISGEGQRLEFPLPAQEDKSASTQLAISFTAAKGKLDPVSGKLGAELPLTPWFIHAIEWSIALPEGYRISAIDGNLDYGQATQAEHQVSLRKSLCRGEAPKVDLFYEKRGL